MNTIEAYKWPSKKRIGLVEINNSFSGVHYLPYSVGSLVSYAKKYLKEPDQYEFLLPIYCRVPVEDAVDRLIGSDAVFFSTYVWNIRISLEIAKRIKSIKPQTLIAFGGPQVPNTVEGFLRTNVCVDLACHNEGEQIFLAILENLDRESWDAIPGVSFIKGDGTLVQNPRPPRLKDFSLSPSPFLTNFFMPLMEASPKEKWISVWETNRGCPFSCSFCDWGSSTQSRVVPFDMERLYEEMEWIAKNKIEFIFCADANFGMLPRDIEIASYIAEIKRKYGYPQALSVQSTKNAKERAYQVQKILADAGLSKGVTIAFQSLDSATLKNIKRDNISSEAFHDLQQRFNKDKIETYTDLILGLPGETYDSYANGVSLLIENGQHHRIQFNNLSILPNAPMADPEYMKQHTIETVATKMINIHGVLDDEEIWETQDLVIATKTMPKGDWVRVRAFSWMTALLHFDKVLQIPLIVIHEWCSVSYRDLIEVFLDGSIDSFPILSEIKSVFFEGAREIQNGGSEYRHSKEWLNIWWPIDEYIFIKLCKEDKLHLFYDEVEEVLVRFLQSRFLNLPANLLHEAILLNKSLIKLPFQTGSLNLELSYNIWEFYQSVVMSEPIPLETKASRYHIDRTSETWSSWEEWCQKVVWYGNKKGAYLYGNVSSGPELAGHY